MLLVGALGARREDSQAIMSAQIAIISGQRQLISLQIAYFANKAVKQFRAMINWRYPLIIAICALIIAWVSSRLAPQAPNVHLKRGFAFLLFAIAAFTIIKELFKGDL